MKIGFVILCYKNFPVIQTCVSRLLCLENINNSEIILVDNCSPDDTGEKLTEAYRNIDNIHIIVNKENFGFAKGNNLGYRYAKNNLACDIQVVMNSDVLIDDKLFITKIMKCIESEPETCLIGPDVLGYNGRHTNPLYPGEISIDIAKKNILYNKIANILLLFHIDYYKRKKKDNNTYEKQEKQYDVMLHGCCIVFCPKWINKENQIFWPGTFLFCEEFFLTAYALRKGYTIMYNPNLVVCHLGDASIDSDITNERKKRIFINTNQNKSLKKYLKFMKDVKTNWNNNF